MNVWSTACLLAEIVCAATFGVHLYLDAMSGLDYSGRARLALSGIGAVAFGMAAVVLA